MNAGLPAMSVLVCTRDRLPLLKACLASLVSGGYPKDRMELLVLDDASGDATERELPALLRDLAARHGIRSAHFRNAGHKGIIHGRKFLADRMSAGSELALFLDDDAVLEPGTLPGLARRLLDHPGAGVAGPRVVFADRPDRTAHAAGFVNRWTGRYSSLDCGQALECDWLLSTCLLATREALALTGGFHPGFYIAHAEVDFCLRVGNAGLKVVYFPSVKVLHHEKPGQLKPERLYYLYRNKFLVLRRCLSGPGRLTALACAALLGTPKHLLQSLARNRGINIAEIKMISRAVRHGLSGLEGRFDFHTEIF